MDTAQAQFSYFTPDEAVHLQLQAIGGPNSSGMGILEVPPAFTSPETQHRIRVTMLHLMGFDHTKLTYNYNGREFRLTDNFGNVIKELIA